jgi:hypothetical protein
MTTQCKLLFRVSLGNGSDLKWPKYYEERWIYVLEITVCAWHSGSDPVILATWEAEFGRLMV